MPNRLINEQSLYLQQHAHNPVDWYPWGDEAFERARNLNRPVLVSIGYAACHWCHVMERESFEQVEVADYMNQHFVNIKVDREEYPDVDHLYMDAVQAITGSGGWPLNVFVTPDRVPFYGGTYFPPRPLYNRPSWLQILQRMHEIWTASPEEVTQQTGQMLDYLKQSSQVSFPRAAEAVDRQCIEGMAAVLLQQADLELGGFGKAPKFPGSMAISFLLEHDHFIGHPQARQHALHSLRAMMCGGIYDQLGGGFARYATDDRWLVPHFEKMLYDNALLLLSLSDAFQCTQEASFRDIIEQTINFINRELRDESGLFYSALDADSEGEEGRYYTWNWQEWSSVIDDPVVTQHFGVTEEGNWEHTNILHLQFPRSESAGLSAGLSPELSEKIALAKEQLLARRAQRMRPATDDKCLLSWNALMNLALTRAGTVLEQEAWLQQAIEHAELMYNLFRQGEHLQHVWKKGMARIAANLDDYAYLIHAFLQLGQATGDPKWLHRSRQLLEVVNRQFLHEDGSFYYFSGAAHHDIPVRKVDLYDGATPSANAVMAHNLLVLGMCFEQTGWIEQGGFLLEQMSALCTPHPASFGYWATLLQRYVSGYKTVVCTGPDAARHAAALRKLFLPNVFVLTSEKQISDLPVLNQKSFFSESLIFVCTQEACLPPVDNVAACVQLISAY